MPPVSAVPDGPSEIDHRRRLLLGRDRAASRAAPARAPSCTTPCTHERHDDHPAEAVGLAAAPDQDAADRFLHLLSLVSRLAASTSARPSRRRPRFNLSVTVMKSCTLDGAVGADEHRLVVAREQRLPHDLVQDLDRALPSCPTCTTRVRAEVGGHGDVDRLRVRRASACRACGRFTSSPCCIIGAVTMKMMSSTSMTSTSGTTLISASEVAT